MARRNKTSLGLLYKNYWFWNEPHFTYSSSASYLGPVQIVLETERLLLCTLRSELLCSYSASGPGHEDEPWWLRVCWVCLKIRNSGLLVFLLQQQSQGTNSWVALLKKRQLYEWDWGCCRSRSASGLLLGRWREMSLTSGYWSAAAGTGERLGDKRTLHVQLSTAPCLTLFCC